MNIEYINPFIEASQIVLKQIANMEAKLGKVYLKDSPYRSDDLIVIVGLTGKMKGQAIFTMSTKVALKIASSMMGGMQLAGLDELSKSAIAELTNMILGNTATLLYNRGIDIEITPPSLLIGENIQVSSSTKMKTICIPLLLNDTDHMDIDITVTE